MNSWWHEGELDVQRRAGVVDHGKLRGGVRDALPPHFCEFLHVQRFLVVASCDARGVVRCSMVPGWPGFAAATSPTTIAIDRQAWDDALLARLQADPRIGLLAIDPSTRRRIRVNGLVSLDADALTIDIIETFGNCRQYIQQRPAEGPVLQRSVATRESTVLHPDHNRWIGAADTCFLASMHPRDGLDASHRGGRPGFVRVLDTRTLRFADYSGNDMFQTLGNLTVHPDAALLFIDFERGATLEVRGRADVEWTAQDSPTGRAVQFTVAEVFESEPETPWRWPVTEYSPVNP